MFQSFNFRLPTDIYVGEGTAASLGEHVRALGAERPFVVTDRGIRAAGLLDPLIQSMVEHGLAPHVFDHISPNPRDHECVVGAERAREYGADLIVAIGGGSPIDAAKAIAGLAPNGGSAQDWEAPRTFELPPLPLIAVPTTAGTGSEVTRSAVITDTARHVKMSLRDIRLAPRIALVDPALTYSLPPATTAATGMDVLTHAVEAFTCRVANPISDALALDAVRLVSRHLETAVRQGDDREARSGMMLASLMAGMAFFNADVGGVHCIAEALGGRYDTPHGVANAVFLPYVFAYNAEAAPERHRAVAQAFGATPDDSSLSEIGKDGGATLKALAISTGIPPLRALPGIDPDDFPAIAEASASNLSNRSNARPMAAADYLRILQQAWAD